jgi:5-methylcytosine-specific restriction endonuclease McrA
MTDFTRRAPKTRNSSLRFELEEFHRNISDDELVADLVRVSRELGKAATFRDYNAVGKFSSSTIASRFGSWLAALERAGLQKTFNRNISNDDLFRNIVELWTKFGKQPKSRDLTSEHSSYSADTYARRFRGWRNALHEFVLWSREANASNDSSPGLDQLTRTTSRNPSWRIRAQVLMRDGATCRLCGANPQSGAKLHVDHLKPWSRGGETTLDNLQILCEICNIGKGDFVTS